MKEKWIQLHDRLVDVSLRNSVWAGKQEKLDCERFSNVSKTLHFSFQFLFLTSQRLLKLSRQRCSSARTLNFLFYVLFLTILQRYMVDSHGSSKVLWAGNIFTLGCCHFCDASQAVFLFPLSLCGNWVIASYLTILMLVTIRFYKSVNCVRDNRWKFFTCTLKSLDWLDVWGEINTCIVSSFPGKMTENGCFFLSHHRKNY